MSNILEITHEIKESDFSEGGVATIRGIVSLASPLNVPGNGRSLMQVCAVTLSDRIPNVFNAAPYYKFDNTIVRLQTDSSGIHNVVLPRGLYATVEQVALGINAAVPAGWYLDPADPALTIVTNSITDKIVATIDSTKLAAPHTWMLCDVRKVTTDTDIGYTLGFSETAGIWQGIAGTSVTFTSDRLAHMDAQGTTCDLQSSLVKSRKRNNDSVETLALISFAGKNTLSDNIWPSGAQVSPDMVYGGSSTIDVVTYDVRTTAGLPMLFMGGRMSFTVSFKF